MGVNGENDISHGVLIKSTILGWELNKIPKI